MIILGLLAGSFLHSQEYIYKFLNNTMPNIRVEKDSGKVEVYSDITKITFTDTMLHNIHKELYKDLKYEDFKHKVEEKYKNIEFKSNEQFRWIEYNQYLEIKKLKEFDTKF